ncbi:hypothetical protein [Embleya sp. NPDC001921]
MAQPRAESTPVAAGRAHCREAGALVLADAATEVEARAAEQAGADAMATTPAGYTPPCAGPRARIRPWWRPWPLGCPSR